MLKKKMITVIGYVFSILLTLLTYKTTHSFGPIVVGLLELLILIIIIDILVTKNKGIAYIVKSFLILLYNVQMAILLFSGTYTTLIMITNLDSLKALSGQLPLYLTATILVIFFSFLPIYKVTKVQIRFKLIILYGILATEMIMLLISQKSFSPSYSVYGVFRELRVQQEFRRNLAKLPDYSKEFYKTDIVDSVKAPETLKDNPNIILIFAEGLSQHIIDDHRQIMPYTKKIQEKSINFKNYYNHTFATYRGLQGQLYSGYQLANFDKSGFTSIQSILDDEGYDTTFINTEPKNNEFTEYLQDFDFNQLTSSKKLEGEADTMTDKEAFNFLMKTLNKKEQSSDPFFVSMYTFGTHASLDSPDDVFEDGSDPQINKFYNFDKHFGEFIEAFDKSKVSDNTIVIFTTDHATFVDAAYSKSFPEVKRNHGMVDQIPFFIYQKGGEGKIVDAKGRNSLNLVPTILDYLDVSAPNYFLGTSLFSNENKSKFDTFFVSEETKISTENETDSTIHPLTQEETSFLNQELEKYFSTKEKRIERNDN